MKKLALFLLLFLPVPAQAGIVYIPFAANAEIHGHQIETRLLVANEGNRPRGFTALFIPAGTDGSSLERAGLPRHFVGRISLEAIDGLVPEGEFGMLEINGAPQLSITAELVLVENGQRISLGPVPTVLPEEGFLASLDTQNSFHALVDYARETAIFGVLNLSRNPGETTCSIAVFKDEPRPAGLVARGYLVPGTSLVLQDVEEMFTDIVGTPIPPTGRGRTRCVGVGPFFSFAIVFGQDRPSVRFVDHLGRSMLSGGF